MEAESEGGDCTKWVPLFTIPQLVWGKRMESERLELPCSSNKRIVWSTLYPQAFLSTLWVVVGYPLRIPWESTPAQDPSCPFCKLQNVYKYFFKRSSWLMAYAIGLQIKNILPGLQQIFIWEYLHSIACIRAELNYCSLQFNISTICSA